MKTALQPQESAWLLMESANAPMHVGTLMVFALPEGAGPDYTEQLYRRLRGASVVPEPWQLRLARRIGRPRHWGGTWEVATDFDIDRHFHHLPLAAPGGERELGMAVERVHSRPLEREHPLWECHLLSGLYGNRYALYFKVHPALTEATDVVRLLANTLADASQPEARAPWATALPGWQRSAGESPFAPLRGPGGLSNLRTLATAYGRLAKAALSSKNPLRAPYTAPYLALHVRTGPQRRVATQQYDRARLAAAAKACDASEGEIVLYLCATALRRFFKEHNALPQDESLVAALPGQQRASFIGLVSLGTQHADPRRRLDVIKRSLRASREHLQTLSPELAPAYTLLATSAYLLGQVTRLSAGAFPMFNLVISSVYGPETPRWLGDSRLEALYPMFPLLRNGAVTIDCLRYAGKLHVAVVGASEEIPRLQRLAVYMGEALADLEERITAGEFQ